MKRISVLMLFVLFAGWQAWAQDEFPRAEVAGGFAFQRSGGENFPGWHASVAGNFGRSVGAVAEITGLHKNFSGFNTSVYEFLFGPRFSARSEKATVFVHVLLGAMNPRVSMSGINVSKNYLAIAYGLGVDVNAGKHVAIRAAQFDVVTGRVEGTWGKDYRYVAGVVFKLGVKK